MYIVPHKMPAPRAAITPNIALPGAARLEEAKASSVAPANMPVAPPNTPSQRFHPGIMQLVEQQETPEDPKQAVRIPQRKGDTQAYISDGIDGQGVGDRPHASRQHRPND